MSAVGVIYLASIPISAVTFYRHKRRSAVAQEPPQVVAGNVVDHRAARLKRKPRPPA